jgi:hypothetical protein
MKGGCTSRRAVFPPPKPPDEQDQQEHQKEVRERPLDSLQPLIALVTLKNTAVVSVTFQSVRGHPVPAKPYFVSTHDTGL